MSDPAQWTGTGPRPLELSQGYPEDVMIPVPSVEFGLALGVVVASTKDCQAGIDVPEEPAEWMVKAVGDGWWPRWNLVVELAYLSSSSQWLWAEANPTPSSWIASFGQGPGYPCQLTPPPFTYPVDPSTPLGPGDFVYQSNWTSVCSPGWFGVTVTLQISTDIKPAARLHNSNTEPAGYMLRLTAKRYIKYVVLEVPLRIGAP